MRWPPPPAPTQSANRAIARLVRTARLPKLLPIAPQCEAAATAGLTKDATTMTSKNTFRPRHRKAITLRGMSRPLPPPRSYSSPRNPRRGRRHPYATKQWQITTPSQNAQTCCAHARLRPFAALSPPICTAVARLRSHARVMMLQWYIARPSAVANHLDSRDSRAS